MCLQSVPWLWVRLFFFLFIEQISQYLPVPDVMPEHKEHLAGPNSPHIMCCLFIDRDGKTTTFLLFECIFPNSLCTTCLLSRNQAFSSQENASIFSRQMLLGAYCHSRKPRGLSNRGPTESSPSPFLGLGFLLIKNEFIKWKTNLWLPKRKEGRIN